MREIKFRLVDPRTKKIVAYVTLGKDYGYSMQTTGNGVSVGMSKADWYQYTGLKDKNGVEIYEGDIVVTDVDVNAVKKGWLFTVEWTTGIGVGLKLYGVGKYMNNHPVDYMDIVGTYFNDQDSEIFEVIGNIYENPELLK